MVSTHQNPAAMEVLDEIPLDRQALPRTTSFAQATSTGSAHFAGARFEWGVPPEVARFVPPPVREAGMPRTS